MIYRHMACHKIYEPLPPLRLFYRRFMSMIYLSGTIYTLRYEPTTELHPWNIIIFESMSIYCSKIQQFQSRQIYGYNVLICIRIFKHHNFEGHGRKALSFRKIQSRQSVQDNHDYQINATDDSNPVLLDSKSEELIQSMLPTVLHFVLMKYAEK